MQKIVVGQLEKQILATRERLLAAINQLPEDLFDEAISRPNVVEKWSIRTLCAFLAEWEKEVAFGLREIQRHKKPTKLITTLENEERFRRQCYQQNQDDEWDDILIDMDDARYQINDRIAPFNRQDLNELKRHRWLGNRQLWPFIAAMTYEHELQFVPAVEAFVVRFKSEMGR